ncbi:hypothetical protein G7046_g9927 [Stylonectria norvegica]|nr:hypothetical protein G7046_g9927 [Stylonectria norvegica]
MNTQLAEPQPTFELLKELRNDVWIAVRKGDPRGEQYLARRIDEFDDLRSALQQDAPLNDDEKKTLAHKYLLYDFGQASAITQILNHENLVSILGSFQIQPFVGKASELGDTPESYLVWDFCDAANLSSLFMDHPLENSSFYLPESLCWHVLRSLTRAVTYLHDGERLFFDSSAPIDEPKKWMSVDKDWLPILHRAIKPVNIRFQHPRGIETYGQCKLGNFSSAAVTNHVLSEQTAPGRENTVSDIGNGGLAMAACTAWEPTDITLMKLKAGLVGTNPLYWPYTLADELWSIGSVVFTMMTGRALTYNCANCGCAHVVRCARGGCLKDEYESSGRICDCTVGGCEHLSSEACDHITTQWPACPHHGQCSHPVINVDSYLERARYTSYLRDAVKGLLEYSVDNRKIVKKAMPHAALVARAYALWRETTEEGKAYRDIEDDMTERWKVARDKEAAQEKLKEDNGGVAFVI